MKFKFEVGQQLKVKPLDIIHKTLDSHGYCGGIYFTDQMVDFCGMECAITDRNNWEGVVTYKITVDDGCYWSWHTDWLEEPTPTISLDEDLFTL